MGHGPAVQRSTNEQYAEFKAKSDLTDSITGKAVIKFKEAAGKIDLKDDVDPPEFASVLFTPSALTRSKRKKPVALKKKSPVEAWGFSKDEFARLNLAAQSLVNLTTIEVNPLPDGNKELKITVGDKAKPWQLPRYTETSVPPKADLEGKFDNEVWLQDSELILFMYMAARGTNIQFNESFLGRAVDVVAQAIPAILFSAKAQAREKRPYELIKGHLVALPRPTHSSWPGGHAFWCGALSVLFFQALAGKGSKDALSKELRQAARRIAENRVSAGLHWQMDTEAGIAQGRFVMYHWIETSEKMADDPNGYPGDAGELWRLIAEV